jgi:hypothetical protein
MRGLDQSQFEPLSGTDHALMPFFSPDGQWIAFEEPMHEAKQMTTGQPVGAASHTTGGFSTVVRIGSKSVSSRSASF